MEDKKKKIVHPSYVEIRKSAGWPPPKEFQKGGYWVVAEQCFATIKNKLKESCGTETNEFRRILDFGCEAGRLMQYWEPHQEVWGIDKNAAAIKWCRENLSPELNFLTSSPYPHLPFQDGYFDFILAFSVFTHIGADYLSWILELRRILDLDGILFLTILDEHTLRKREIRFNSIAVPRERLKEEGVLDKDFLIAHTKNLTFFKKDNIIHELQKYFNIMDYTPGVFNFQTGVVLTHRA